MALVAAICTQCGANIEVDNSKDAGICQHCGTAFITEKAINNYITNISNNLNISDSVVNVNIAGQDKRNYLNLANAALEKGHTAEAISYYTKYLELDSDDYEISFWRDLVRSSEITTSDYPEAIKTTAISYKIYANAVCNDESISDDEKTDKLKNVNWRILSQVMSRYNYIHNIYIDKKGRVDKYDDYVVFAMSCTWFLRTIYDVTSIFCELFDLGYDLSEDIISSTGKAIEIINNSAKKKFTIKGSGLFAYKLFPPKETEAAIFSFLPDIESFRRKVEPDFVMPKFSKIGKLERLMRNFE